MARPCKICSNGEHARLTSEMIAAGSSDQAIADRIGGIDRMSVGRHRRNHIIAPAKAVAEMAGKGADAAAQRSQVMAAAASGDPMAFVGLAAITDDLRRVHDRLERTADAAEQDRQRLAVASLSAQQLRAAEVRARMGNVGGFSPGKAGGDGAAGTTFAVNINFGGERRETISVTASTAAPMIQTDLFERED